MELKSNPIFGLSFGLIKFKVFTLILLLIFTLGFLARLDHPFASTNFVNSKPSVYSTYRVLLSDVNQIVEDVPEFVRVNTNHNLEIAPRDNHGQNLHSLMYTI